MAFSSAAVGRGSQTHSENGMRIFQEISGCAVLLGSLAGLAHGAGDPTRGSRVFGQCAACHSVANGAHMTGPSLAKVWNQKAAGADGFSRYSEALKRAGVVWNAATLDAWLVNPGKFLPGTSMTFSGIKEAKDRQDVIAYLKAVSEGKAPQAQQGGRAMTGMGREKLDLRKAPAEGRVTAVTLCGDTYTVGTADGKSQKIWEFNLRFKTDSSKLGPLPGKPVAVGAGMQGDRASVVFASPKEISEFIKQSCP
jgi:cytochrome c